MRPTETEIRTVLGDIRAAKALQIKQEEGKIVVKIPETLILSNEYFGRIHERLATMGGTYIKRAQA